MTVRIVDTLLTAGMLLLAFAVYQGWECWTINGRPRVEAEVLSSVIATKTRPASSSRGTRMETRRGVAFSLRYRFEGQEHRAKVFDDGWRGANEYLSLEEVKKGLQAGTKVLAYVNPSNPLDVRLEGQSYEGALVWLCLGVSSIVMAFVTAWGATKPETIEDIE